MSNLHQKIIELVAAPENRDEVAGACMTMRADGSWAVTIVTRPRVEAQAEVVTGDDAEQTVVDDPHAQPRLVNTDETTAWGERGSVTTYADSNHEGTYIVAEQTLPHNRAD